MIYIASDHAGYDLKNFIISKLTKHEVTDLGPHTFDPQDDYPFYVNKVMEKVTKDPQSLGILVCKNGVGVSMMANKYKNIRAALTWNPKHAISSKLDDNTNVLALPAGFISKSKGARIVKKWLKTKFKGEDRHNRRLDMQKELGSQI